MENFEKLFANLPLEIAKSLEAMSRTNDPNLRKVHSEIIYNLTSSFATFVKAISEAGDEFDDFDDEDYLDNFESPFAQDPPKKSGKGKKGKRDNEIPF